MQARPRGFSVLIILLLFSLTGCDFASTGKIKLEDYFEIIENDIEDPELVLTCNPNETGYLDTAICITDKNNSKNPIELIVYKEKDPYLQAPTWSPTGNNKIAFMCKIGKSNHICVIDSQGKEGLLIASQELESSDIGNPIWSPDGNRILFRFNTANGSGNFTRNIGVVNLNGELLTWSHEVQDYVVPFSEPRWSPDGSEISFICKNPNISGICIFNSDGSGSIRSLVDESYPEEVWINNQQWSPNGDQIVYSCLPDICVVNLVGTPEVLNLSELAGHDTGADTRPRWSPNGNQILYRCAVGGNSGVYDDWCLLNANGEGQRINVTETFKALGYRDTMVSFPRDGSDAFIYNCKGYDRTACYTYGDDLGSVYEFLSNVSEYVE